MAASPDRLTNLRTGRTVTVWHAKPTKLAKPVHRRSNALRRAEVDAQWAIVLTALLCVCLSIIY